MKGRLYMVCVLRSAIPCHVVEPMQCQASRTCRCYDMKSVLHARKAGTIKQQVRQPKYEMAGERKGSRGGRGGGLWQ